MTDIIDSEEREKSLYLTQIRYLDEHLERCQRQCDELEKQNEDLSSQYSMLEEDKKDISEYLKWSIAAKMEELEELESQQQAIEQDRDTLKLQHRQEIEELQEQLNELNSVTMMQAAKCEKQEEQLIKLMQQLANVDFLENQLVSQKKEHEATIENLMMDEDFGRQKLTSDIQETVENCVKRKTENIVQEERAEHRKYQEKFLLLLKKNLDLWEEKKSMSNEIRSLCKKIDNLLKDFNKITQQILTGRKQVEQQKKECQQLEVALQDSSITHKNILTVEEELRQALVSISDDVRRTSTEIVQLEAMISKQLSRRRQLERIMQEALIILRHIMKKSKQGCVTLWMIKKLLEVLEGGAPQGTESTLDVSTERSIEGQRPQSTDPKPDRAQNPDTDPLFLLARYRPGDLGFIPRPLLKHKPAVSTSAQLLLSRKLCSQETSSSAYLPPLAAQQTDSKAGTSTSADC